MPFLRINLILLFLSFVLISKSASVTDSVMVYNAGKNGNSTKDLLLRVDKEVAAVKPQLVVMMAGTNDRFHPKKLLSLAEYEQNYQLLITKIRKHSDLILMTIPPVYDPYIIKRKPELQLRGNEPNARVDSVNAVIKRLAAKNKCILIDLNKILTACGGADTEKDGLFQNEANFGIADGVHPTAAGCSVIAAAVYQTIQALMPKVKTVICFGDSITRGYRLKGEGTTEGQVYPALLKKMLNLK